MISMGPDARNSRFYLGATHTRVKTVIFCVHFSIRNLRGVVASQIYFSQPVATGGACAHGEIPPSLCNIA